MDEYPDSVLQLLNIQPEEIEDFSDKECARYALLLARATDKCEQSLLPCDSLLNIALEYYDDEEKERAVALLYKGRLEVEMNSTEDAIVYFPPSSSSKKLKSPIFNIYTYPYTFLSRYYPTLTSIYMNLQHLAILDIASKKYHISHPLFVKYSSHQYKFFRANTYLQQVLSFLTIIAISHYL